MRNPVMRTTRAAILIMIVILGVSFSTSHAQSVGEGRVKRSVRYCDRSNSKRINGSTLPAKVRLRIIFCGNDILSHPLRDGAMMRVYNPQALYGA